MKYQDLVYSIIIKFIRKESLWIPLILPLLLLLTNINGLAPDGDSNFYITASENLIKKGYLELSKGKPYYMFPPLYPILLAFFQKITNSSIGFTAMYIQIIAMIMFAYKVIQEYCRYSSFFFNIIVYVAVVFSSELFKYEIFILTETTFISLSLWAFSFGKKYCKSQKINDFIILCILASLLPLLKYMGLVFCLTGSLLLFDSKKVKRWLIFNAVAYLPIFLWFIRNYYYYGTVEGGHLSYLFHFDIDFSLLLPLLSRWGIWFCPFAFLRVESMIIFWIVAILLSSIYLIIKYPFAIRIIKYSYLWETVYFILYLLILLVIIQKAENYPYSFHRLFIPLFYLGIIFEIFIIYCYYHILKKFPKIRIGIQIMLTLTIIHILRNILTHLWIRRYGTADFSLSEWILQILG